MKLLQSIFGAGESLGRYPESLVEAAIERAVDGTDARLRLLPGYRNRLRQPVIHAIDQVMTLVDAFPSPLAAGRGAHSDDPRLAAIFASAAEMLDTFSRDTALEEYLKTPEGATAKQISALLLAERVEKNLLGMDLVNDQVRRDVHQVAVSFTGHRLLDPRVDEAEMRRQLKRRAFDHLLTLALARIAEIRVEREELRRQRDLLHRKCAALEGGGWSFAPAPDGSRNPTELAAELDAITAQLDAIGADKDVLKAHLGIVEGSLGEAERQLWAEPISLLLDPMNIERDAHDPTTRRVDLQELHNARGRRAVLLPLVITPADLPLREDFVTAAERYL